MKFLEGINDFIICCKFILIKMYAVIEFFKFFFESITYLIGFFIVPILIFFIYCLYKIFKKKEYVEPEFPL